MNRYDVTLYDPLDGCEVLHRNVKADSEAKAIRQALHRMTHTDCWHVQTVVTHITQTPSPERTAP